MKVEKVENGRKVKWFVVDAEGKAIAGFTTKRAALQAIESYKKNWGWK